MNDKKLKLADKQIRKTRRLYPESHPLREGVRKARTYRLAPSDMDLAMSLSYKYGKVEDEAKVKHAAQEGQRKSTVSRHENLEPRNRWIREQYDNAKKKNPRYSYKQLRKALMKSRKFPKAQLQISEERLRRVIKGTLTSV